MCMNTKRTICFYFGTLFKKYEGSKLYSKINFLSKVYKFEVENFFDFFEKLLDEYKEKNKFL